MANFNKVVIVGNLTRDPEVRFIPSGTAVADLGIAINDRVKKNDEWVEETTYVDCTAWGRTAETAGEYLHKGSNVLIEGRLKLESWETDGQKRSKLKVVVEKLQFLDKKNGGSTETARQPETVGAGVGTDDNGGTPPDDDIPF